MAEADQCEITRPRLVDQRGPFAFVDVALGAAAANRAIEYRDIGGHETG
jgi:hypothetical protein